MATMERNTLIKNLSSISITDVDNNAVAKIKNTSIVDGSNLFVKIYKPNNFENPIKNEEFLKYTAATEDDYKEKRQQISNFEAVSWNKEPILRAQLAIGETAIFHLKDCKETRFFMHFAPIKIIISSAEYNKERNIRYMLYQFSSPELIESANDDFMKNKLHPYGEWILVYSKSVKDA